MKRILVLMISILAMVFMVGCGSNKAEQAKELTTSTAAPTATASANGAGTQNVAAAHRTLVVYFSMPETTNPNNMTREEDLSTVVKDGKVLGNTEYMAGVIANTTGADVFRIVPTTPYPTDHKTLIAQAKQEQNQEARPAFEGTVPDLSNYDTVFIGYPNWWGDLPMVMYTFLENTDLSGKTIIPFGTHGGSGFSDTINTIARLEPNAKVNRDGLTISRNDIQDGESTIVNWLAGLGYTK